MKNQDLFSQLLPLAAELKLAKGELLFRQGETEGSLFLLMSGLAKAFYSTCGGRDYIKSFLVEGDFIASMQTLVTGESNRFSVICLEQCRWLKVPPTGVKLLLERDPESLGMVNQMLLQLAMKKERREYELLCLSAEEAYLRFCEREPALLQRLSQQDLALYLGITPVALSRIRRRCGLIGGRQG